MRPAAEPCDVTYQKIYEDAVARHGARTLVLFQVGAFYEIYARARDEAPILTCTDVLYLNAVRRVAGSRVWYQCGFKRENVDRYRRMLLERGYTAVIVEQDEEDAHVRRVVQTVSPGLDTEGTESTVAVALVCADAIHIARLDALINRTELIEIRTADVGGGASLLSRVHRAVIERGPCNELEVHCDASASPLADQDAVGRLFSGCAVRCVDRRVLGRKGRFVYDRRWQRLCLETHMGRHVGVGEDIIGKLGMRDAPAGGVAAYVLLLALVSSHDPTIVSTLEPPLLSAANAHDALGELQLSDDTGRAIELLHSEHVSVVDIYNRYVRTRMGRRALRERLRRPSACARRIANWLGEVRSVRDGVERGDWCEWKRRFAEMVDVDRMAVRVASGKLGPSEMPALMRTVLACREVLAQAPPEVKLGSRAADLAVVEASLPTLVAVLAEFFEADPPSGDALHDVFVRGGGPRIAELDDARARMALVDAAVTAVCDEVDALVDKPHSVSIVDTRAGFVLVTTRARAQVVAGTDGARRFSFCPHSRAGAVRFDDAATVELMRRYGEAREQLDAEARRLFRQVVAEMHAAFFAHAGAAFGRIVGHLDMLHGVAQHAIEHRYTAPTVEPGNEAGGDGSVEADGVRHPVVELHVEKEGRPFRSNSVRLGAQRSMLLHGVNSAGKSCLLKSVAINVVLAQSGLFVACGSMVLRPYRAIVLHVGGRDDTFRAQSTFVKEVEEMNAVLRVSSRDGGGLLFLADELGSSTEDESAVRIVSSLLHVLVTRGVTVLLATHMFALQANPFVRGLTALSNWHMRVVFEGDRGIVFDRELQPGLPEEMRYGVRIASKLLAEHAAMVAALKSGLHARGAPAEASATISRYNRDVVAMRCCFCDYRPTAPTDRPLEMHHIEEQRSAVDGFVPSGKRVHASSNQVAACMRCHDEIDRGHIVVQGFEDTLDGRRLRWHRAEG